MPGVRDNARESIDMKRRLFTILSALSLLMLVSVVVLWVRSYWALDSLGYRSGRFGLYLDSTRGLICVLQRVSRMRRKTCLTDGASVRGLGTAPARTARSTRASMVTRFGHESAFPMTASLETNAWATSGPCPCRTGRSLRR